MHYLGDGEEEKWWTRRHPAAVLFPFLVTIGVAYAASRIGATSSPRSGADPVDTVLGWIVFAFVIRFLFKLLEWRYDVIFVTDRRIFEVKGLVPHHVYSMSLWKVTDLTYQRTFWGLLFGYGALIQEAGQDHPLDHINYLPDPAFYEAVNSQEGAFEAPTRAGGGPPDDGGGGPGPDAGGPGVDRYDTPPFP